MLAAALCVKSDVCRAVIQLPSACNVCSYRTRDDIKKVRKERDPIVMFKQIILDKGLATEEELKVSSQSWLSPCIVSVTVLHACNFTVTGLSCSTQ